LGFGGAVAAEEPFAVDDFIEVEAGFGGIREVALVVVFDELLEVGKLFGGKDEGFGVDAGFKGIHGRCGFACDRGGAGGSLRVAAVGFYLTLGGHMIAPMVDGQGCLSYFEDKREIQLSRG
jgi:hypothetical protein